ncbi:hypothetical protein V8G54_036733, partial [Vigna mungo]
SSWESIQWQGEWTILNSTLGSYHFPPVHTNINPFSNHISYLYYHGHNPFHKRSTFSNFQMVEFIFNYSTLLGYMSKLTLIWFWFIHHLIHFQKQHTFFKLFFSSSILQYVIN